MAVPMMLLSLVEQLGEEDEELTSKYAELGDWCAHRILQHVQVGTQREGQNELHSPTMQGPLHLPPVSQAFRQVDLWKLIPLR